MTKKFPRKFHSFMISNHILLSAAFLLSPLLKSTGGFCFPENIRHGYGSCETCHVSPSGAGLLTPYGKSLASELQSTWGETQERLFPRWLNVGGDQRQIYLKSENIETYFHMQSELELGLGPLFGFTAVGSVGFYGPDQKAETRRLYLKHQISRFGYTLISRLGKFQPAYGIMFDDHTLSVKRAYDLGQGNETYNYETSIQNSWFKIEYTQIIGEPDKSKGLGIPIKNEFNSVEGGIVRGQLFLYKTYAIGYSYSRLMRGLDEKINHGPFFKLAPTDWSYVLGQYDYYNADQTYIAGLEIWKGLHIIGGFENNDKIISGIRWFPLYGIEINGQIKNSKESKQIIFISHLYF